MADNTFPLFSKLPAEIRLLVWGMAHPGPRIVHLNCDEPLIKDQEHLLHFYSDTPSPVALKICHESRKEALQHFTPIFATKNHTGLVYFDFSCDALLPEDIYGSCLLLTLWTKDYLGFRSAFERIRHFVVIKNGCLSPYEKESDLESDFHMLDILATSPHLESITMVDPRNCKFANENLLPYLFTISERQEFIKLKGRRDECAFREGPLQFPSVRIVEGQVGEVMDHLTKLLRGEVTDNSETPLTQIVAKIRNWTDEERVAVAEWYDSYREVDHDECECWHLLH